MSNPTAISFALDNAHDVQIAQAASAAGGARHREDPSDADGDKHGYDHDERSFRPVKNGAKRVIPVSDYLRGKKRQRELSPGSPNNSPATRPQQLVSPFSSAVPIDLPGPEPMAVDSEGTKDTSVANALPLPGTETVTAFTVTPATGNAGGPASTRERPHDSPATPFANAPGPSPTSLPTTSGIEHAALATPLSAPGPSQPTDPAPATHASQASTVQAPAGAAQIPVPHAHATAAPIAQAQPAAGNDPQAPLVHVPAPVGQGQPPAPPPGPRPGDLYSPFANDLLFVNLPEANMKIIFIEPSVRPVYRPSPSQVTNNTTVACIEGFNGLLVPKFIAWIHGVGYRFDSAAVVATLREHITALTPSGLANEIVVSPFHAEGNINPANPMPWYFVVSGAPQEVVDVFVATHRFHCEDGFTFYTCPYDATIRGVRYIAAFNKLTYAVHQAADVAATFANSVLPRPEIRNLIEHHNDAIPDAHRQDWKSIQSFLASTVEASPLDKGGKIVWRIYMQTPTQNTAAFDELVELICHMTIPTVLYNVGRHFKIHACRLCRSLDHSYDSCPGPCGLIPGWRDRATTHARDQATPPQHAPTLPLPMTPSLPLPHDSYGDAAALDTRGGGRGTRGTHRDGRGGGRENGRMGGHQHRGDGHAYHDRYDYPRNRGGYRGGGRGGRRGDRGYGRGGYMDQTYYDDAW